VPAEPVYDDFVRISSEIMRGRNSSQQKLVVRNVLMSLLPPGAPEQFRWAALAGLRGGGRAPGAHAAAGGRAQARPWRESAGPARAFRAAGSGPRLSS
jgi:hypothetical protein